MHIDPQKRKIIISAVVFVFIVAVIYFLFIFQKGPKDISQDKSSFEIKNVAELQLSQRPYVTLTPTADGAEIIVSMENISFFDRIEYEIIYLADNPQISGEKIQRGATGTDVNTKDAKYKKDILLGTASKGAKSPDKGIADGKLLLHMYKGEIQYDSETPWNLLQIGPKQNVIEGFNGNFKLQLPSFPKEYWVILSDTVGIPTPEKFDIQKLQLPTYGVFTIAPKFSKKSPLNIKVEGEGDYELHIYDFVNSVWGKPDSVFNKSTKTLTSQIEYFSTFTVVSK